MFICFQSIIDAKMMGNKLRFANHSKIKQNSYSKVNKILIKIIFSKGCYKIGIFAKKDISQYEEILFDYDGQNLLLEKYDWVDDNKKPNREKIAGKRKREEIRNEVTYLTDKIVMYNKTEINPIIKKRIKLKNTYRTNDSYAKEDGFYIDIKFEESNF